MNSSLSENMSQVDGMSMVDMEGTITATEVV